MEAEFANKQKNYYVVVYQPQRRLLLMNGQLPFFWKLKTATQCSEKFEGTEVLRVNQLELEKLFTQ